MLVATRFFLLTGGLLSLKKKYTVLYLRANGLYFPIFSHNFIYLCVKENGDGIVLVGEISEGGNMEMDKLPSKAALNNDS